MTGANANAKLLARTIPKSGEPIPAIGLGTWQAFDIAGNRSARAEAREALARFIELGGKLVDSSPMYGSAEAAVGELAQELRVHQRLFLATKVWTRGREEGIRQMEESLRKMRIPRERALDLMQVHNLVDAKTHLAVLRDWKAAGRIRYVGLTHYHESAYAELEQLLREAAPDFVQFNYSLAERSAGARLLGVAHDTGTAVIVNRPFAEGAMFRRVRNKPLPAWAAEFDCATWAQFFLKWIVSHPAVTCAIPGTRNARHVEDNLGAGLGRLPDDAMRRNMARHFDALA
ncbi:MAG: aldo/keto reductase [Betaproteobacteria bacterium]|nr:aldo/keto reductase [Betaproteobacteria bacterium]MBI2960212.1 aldo/keto reductase [Betaproteobacteria bacterium]